MNKIFKKFIYLFLFLLLISPVMVSAVTDFGTSKITAINVPQGSSNLEGIVAKVINYALGLLALVAIVIILIAGFEWMTAGGNDDKVKTAQKRLKYGLIGLIIIFLAYGIVTWLFSTLATQITGTTP